MEYSKRRWAPARAASVRTRRAGAFLALAYVLIVGAGVLAWGAPPESKGDRIFFSKSFPGSVPPYFEVTVDSAGNASYREDQADEDPIEFQLRKEETSEVFELAEKLNRFRGELASDRKVAFTGQKTLRYSSADGEQTESRFSYTTEQDAQAIVAWFESAGETERHLIDLERVVRFDKLGVNKAILLFQSSFDKGRVVGAEQFLPILKSIAEDSKFMHMARARAASLVERIERGEPKREN